MYSGSGLRGFSTYGNMVRSPKNPTFSQDESLWKSRPPAFLSRVNDRAAAVVSLLISRCLFTSGVERAWRRPCRRTWWAWQRPRITRPSKCFLRASGLKSISWSPVRSWEDDEANFLGGCFHAWIGLGWGSEKVRCIVQGVQQSLKSPRVGILEPSILRSFGMRQRSHGRGNCSCQRAPATPTLEPDALIIATRNIQPIAAVTCSHPVSMSPLSRYHNLKVPPQQCQEFANGTEEPYPLYRSGKNTHPIIDDHLIAIQIACCTQGTVWLVLCQVWQCWPQCQYKCFIVSPWRFPEGFRVIGRQKA